MEALLNADQKEDMMVGVSDPARRAPAERQGMSETGWSAEWTGVQVRRVRLSLFQGVPSPSWPTCSGGADKHKTTPDKFNT